MSGSRASSSASSAASSTATNPRYPSVAGSGDSALALDLDELQAMQTVDEQPLMGRDELEPPGHDEPEDTNDTEHPNRAMPTLQTLGPKPKVPQRTPEELAELAHLWTFYKKNAGHKSSRDKLILQYLHLVRYVVARLPISLPSSISPEDLLSYGTIGLMEAIERFEPERGLKFETYAMTRIRGSIIDQLRTQDWIPRGVRKRSRDLQETFARLEETLKRPPTDEELAGALGVTKNRVQTMLAESTHLVLSLDDQLGSSDDGGSLSLIDTVVDRNSPDPQGEVENSEMRRRLAEAIGSLPEREKLLIALYYHENMTLKEIGDIICVSESRVCQLHAQAILRLRKRLNQDT
jgi:RNA polymerase sigma factor FliA